MANGKLESYVQAKFTIYVVSPARGFQITRRLFLKKASWTMIGLLGQSPRNNIQIRYFRNNMSGLGKFLLLSFSIGPYRSIGCDQLVLLIKQILRLRRFHGVPLFLFFEVRHVMLSLFGIDATMSHCIRSKNHLTPSSFGISQDEVSPYTFILD